MFGPVSFELRRGEILGFAGLMGSGRTEVARAVFGADPVDAGEVELQGKRLSIHSPIDAIRNGIAYLSEDRKGNGLALQMTVAKNITLANVEAVSGAGGFIRFEEEAKVARRYVDALGIRTPSVNQITRNLSGGNQQKVVISKWLFRESKILFFDEPTRGIDVGAKYAIYELMDRLARAGYRRCTDQFGAARNHGHDRSRGRVPRRRDSGRARDPQHQSGRNHALRIRTDRPCLR